PCTDYAAYDRLQPPPSRPPQGGPLVLLHTLAQIHIDQILIRDSEFDSKLLEVIDRLRFQTDRHLFLEQSAVGVLLRLTEVVFLLHGNSSSYCWRSDLVALRAEMIRISASSAR